MRLRLLAATAALLLPTACGLPQAGISMRYLNLDVEGDILVTESSSTASADLETMGLEKDDGVFSPRVDLEWGGFHLSASSSQSDHSGQGVVESELEYNGETITAGSNVQSDFELGLTNLLMTWDLIPGDTVEIGLGVGAMLMDLDANIQSLDVPGENIELDEQFPIPMLAGRAGLELYGFDLEGVLAGMSVNVDGDEATVLDLDVALSYELVDIGGAVCGELFLGYRSFDIDVQYDDDEGAVDFDSSFNGPYFGIALSF